MQEAVLIDNLNLEVPIPDFFGKTSVLKATWVRHVEREIFEMAFGITSWLVEIKEGKIPIPLSCTLYFSDKEYRLISLCESLNMSQFEIREKIYKERISEYYAGKE
jgi:hypothetical protein